MAAYANWLGECAEKYGVQIHGWVLMTNQVHLLMTPQTEFGITKLMQTLGRLYVRYFNYGYRRSGTLFEGRYKSSVVQQEQYLLSCQRYIEHNPVRAGMVKDPGDYRWSSYRAHAFGIKPSMWSPHSLYEALGVSSATRQSAYRELFSTTLEVSVHSKPPLTPSFKSERIGLLANLSFQSRGVNDSTSLAGCTLTRCNTSVR